MAWLSAREYAAGYKLITKANRVCATMGRVKRISRTRDVILKCTGSVADDPSEDKMVSANESMADDTKNTLVQMQQYNWNLIWTDGIKAVP